MTPKEKAEQLVRKYYTFGLNNPAQSFSWYECKECSLIAVDEILDEQNDFIQTKGYYNYWKEVKTEINKL
jgi:hypothetical protein